MSETKTVLITGASGNLGDKLSRFLSPNHSLRLLDRNPRGDGEILAADLSQRGDWTEQFRGVDTVFHLAADPTAQQTWPNVIAPNIDALIHVFLASVQAGVKRIVYASSNHIMGGYKDLTEPFLITTDLPPLPGTKYVVESEVRDSTPYASAKLFGERLGKSLAERHQFTFIAVRLGWVRPGENRACDIPADREEWFQLMWLSNRDYLQLMQRCLEAPLREQFVIVHGMSANRGMRWDLGSTRRLLGYEPVDDVRG
jgi:NAD+ dependent glucose-6-phosphate dehydrogenase